MRCYCVIVCALALLSSCSALQSTLADREPEVSIDNVRLTGINMDKVSMLFNLAVTNPNSIGARIEGFDYRLAVEDATLAEGSNATPVTVAASSQSTVPVPVSVRLQDLLQIAEVYKTRDTLAYNLACGLQVKLPVVGTRRLPLSHAGELPVVHVPTVSIESCELKDVGLTSASLLLRMTVDNPNAFDLSTKALAYALVVNDEKWVDGALQQPLTLRRKDSATFTLPVKLNLLTLGKGAYQMLVEKQSLNYSVRGSVDAATSLKDLKQFRVPFAHNGTFTLSR